MLSNHSEYHCDDARRTCFKVTDKMTANPLSSVTYLNQFIRFSREQGIDIEDISAKLLAIQGQDFVAFEDFKLLISDIMQKSDEAWLGLHFAEKVQISSHGSLGFALSHGINLNECLALISRYYQTRLQAIEIKGFIEHDTYLLTIFETCDWHPIRTLLYEVLISSLLNVIEYIIGHDVHQCSVSFPYPEPEWADKYHELIPCPVSFNQHSATISIPQALLSIPSISANSRSVDLAKSQCDIELNRLSHYHTLTDKITSLIEGGQNFHLNLDEVAKHLNVSKSTLSRRLKQKDTSYKIILETLKKQEARNLLLNSEISIEAIALKLGYEDHSNFGRSFKRWFGCSPSIYRQTH